MGSTVLYVHDDEDIHDREDQVAPAPAAAGTAHETKNQQVLKSNLKTIMKPKRRTMWWWPCGLSWSWSWCFGAALGGGGVGGRFLLGCWEYKFHPTSSQLWIASPRPHPLPHPFGCFHLPTPRFFILRVRSDNFLQFWG
ncbi:hypothetical protein CRG98_037008 [Punica granatum]|uniref:Uncharacterized protein n=1 Tax=Punica granatum TaxID=22663 RepID=A0A2I0IF09_PUNGR|nr:hypothetical protein CRG98_037008 [Punica granatum]